MARKSSSNAKHDHRAIVGRSIETLGRLRTMRAAMHDPRSGMTARDWGFFIDEAGLLQALDNLEGRV